MRKLLFFRLFFLFPTLCWASSDDPCYPDQHPFNAEECDSISEIRWDTENSVSEIPTTGNGTIYVLDGKPGFTYEVSGTNFYLDASGMSTKEEEVTDRQHQIYTINACGTGKVTVTDSCGKQATGLIQTDIALKWDETSFIEEMAANDTHQLKLTGLPPFTFTVEGNGFYFDTAGTLKTITTSGQSVVLHTIDACGTARVSVHDSCNDIISLEVRSTSGRWARVGTFNLILGLIPRSLLRP